MDDIGIVVDEKDGCPCTNPGSVDVTPVGPLSLCTGIAGTLSASAEGGTEPLSYQWTLDGSPVSGATGAVFSATSLVAGTHNYNCRVTGSGCSGYTEDSQAVAITWNGCTAPPEVSGNAAHHLQASRNAGSVNLVFEDVGAAHYQLYVSNSPDTSDFKVSDSIYGNKDCSWSVWADGGEMLTVSGLTLEAGITGSTAVLYFLVTGDNGPGAEGPLGQSSDGTPRTADGPCDP